jgi:membrane protein DedA with SNARE-associated domain
MDLMTLVDPLMTSPLLYPLLTGLSSLDGVLPMIPSEAAVLTAGVFAHSGTPSLLFVVVATALGVFIGDHLAYGLSRSVAGPRLIARSKHVSRAVAAAGRQLDRRPALLIVLSRFLPGGRVAMNLACGSARLPLSRFSPASAIAALAWAAYTAGLGFLGGASFAENPLLALAVGLGLSFVFGGVAELIRRRTARRRPPSGRGPAPAGDRLAADGMDLLMPLPDGRGAPRASASEQSQRAVRVRAQLEAIADRPDCAGTGRGRAREVGVR